MAPRSLALPLLVAVISMLAAGPVVAACVDWSVAAPTAPHAPFDGPFFHDLPGGVMREGFLTKHLLSSSGLYFTQTLYVFDVRVAGQPREMGSLGADGSWLYDSPATFALEDVDGDHCVVSTYGTYGHGRALFTSTPTGGVRAHLSTFRGKVSLHGGRAFQIIDDPWEPGLGVACLNISTPATPVTLGQLAGSFTDLKALDDSRVLMRTGDGRLQVVDFATPATPVLRGSLTIAFTRWLGTAGGRVVIVAGTQTVGIDVSDPDDPYVAWWVPGAATAMTTDGDLMALGFEGTGATLALFDISGGAPNPLNSAFGNEPSTSIGLAISGDVLYTGGICAYDITDPENPLWLGQAGVTCNHAGALDVSSTFTVAGEELITPHGLVWAHCADAADVPASPAALTVAAHPNPFNPMTTITFTTAQDGPVSVALYDARGRLVRSLADGTMAAGPQAVRWDGRGDDGQVAAAGMYVVRVTTPAGVSVGKVVMAK